MLNLDYSNLAAVAGTSSGFAPGDVGAIAASGIRKEHTRAIEALQIPAKLKEALDAAVVAENYIVPEQARIRELLADAKNETEIAAREYQLEYVERYLTRAAELARQRLAHLATITTKKAVEAEIEHIKSDKHYWFRMYAWGYDPRARTPLSVVPFELYDTQAKYVDWLDDLVFNRRTSGLVEKARDEGATETTVRWGIYNWLYRQGFSMLLSSRKEDEIDSKKNQNTLFERIRYQLRLLPTWQLPKGFDLMKDMNASMLIANPANQNTLMGEAPVENMGRGGRVTVGFFDEPAFWSFAGYPQYRSFSQTTDSIILCSSVGGKLNQFADLAFDGVTPKFVMDWRDNPFKDKRWYDSLPYGYISPKMSRTTIAQEVDRNYDAAQPGKVFHIKEEFVFITESEFLRPFAEANLKGRFFDEDGKFRIPEDWRVTRLSDYGQTEGHDWGYVLAAQPTQYYPLNDTHFVFVARNLEPTGLSTAEAVKLWRGYEQFYGVRDRAGKFRRDPWASYNSHEQKELRQVLLTKYGENWYPWNAEYNVGIETLNDWWTPEEKEKPNPFRPQLMGRCRFIFVAPDSEYQLAYNERLSTHFITMSDSEAGFFTARKQLSAYHYPESELGKAVKAMRPVKEFDDIVDPLKAYGKMWNMAPPKASANEQYLTHLAENAPDLLPENIAVVANEEARSLTLAREEIERREFEKRKNKAKYQMDDELGEYLRQANQGEFHEL